MAVSVEWCRLYADWSCGRRLFTHISHRFQVIADY